MARTAAFFSHNMAPLSSRTVRFISGVHFPPGVVNAPNAALYGIENTNRGCDLNVAFNPEDASRAALGADRVQAGATLGLRPGIVTGKLPDDRDDGDRIPAGIPLYRVTVNAGGIPLYKNGKLLGGIGVVGIAGDPQLAEFAAVTGAFGARHGIDRPCRCIRCPSRATSSSTASACRSSDRIRSCVQQRRHCRSDWSGRWEHRRDRARARTCHTPAAP